MLLRPDDTSRSTDSKPRNNLGGRELVVLHAVAADARARSSQSRLAVDADRSCCLFAHFQELPQDLYGRVTSIKIVHVDVVDAILQKFLSIVVGLVQSYYE